MAGLSLTEYDERTFYGTWRVCKFEAFDVGASAKSSDSKIEGTEWTLEETYDVRWKIPQNVEAIPLFSCESYEVILTHPAQLSFISTTVGRIGPFAAEFESLTQLQLTFDKAFVFYCEKVPQSEQIQESPFSFLPALETGYFSDLVITSASGKNHHVHQIILKLGCPTLVQDCVSLSSKPSRSYQASVLDGLPDSVLTTILHYLYSESLPAGLSENGARECAVTAEKINGLEELGKLCRNYLENYAVRKIIERLCDELECCGRNILSHVRSKPEGSQILSEPAALWQGFKCAAREFAVAALKILQICKLFSDHRNDLSREERHHILKHCRDRLPALLMLNAEFCEMMLSYLGRQSREARMELASYFLVEAEPLFDEADKVVSEIRKTLETIINSDVSAKRRQKESVLAKTLKNAVHIKELAKLRRLHTEMVECIENLILKREHFALLSDADKAEAVSNVIECASDEISLALNRITNWHDHLDARITWTQWKYFFKMGAAKVAWIVEKSKCSRASISKALGAVRKLIRREEFDAGLASVGLLDSRDGSLGTVTGGARSAQLQDIESLCVSPGPRDSILSSRSEQTFKELDSEKNFADMKFIIHNTNNDGEKCTKIIGAHRIIVACRCDWFRRALLSGMKEDIQREINVYDCNPDLFLQFLMYLYTGKLNCSATTVDVLADLITLSDQYEVDSLKSVCEGALEPLISNENVLELLVIGERFNAASLRECCMDHVLRHPDVLESEVFSELPQKLQVEVRDLTEWNQRSLMEKMPSMTGGKRPCCNQTATAQTSSSETNADLSSEMDMIDRLTHALHVRHLRDDDDEVEDRRYVESCEACCAELRNVLGSEVSAEELERVAAAADFDVNRALNYYFSSPGSP